MYHDQFPLWFSMAFYSSMIWAQVRGVCSIRNNGSERIELRAAIIREEFESRSSESGEIWGLGWASLQKKKDSDPERYGDAYQFAIDFS